MFVLLSAAASEVVPAAVLLLDVLQPCSLRLKQTPGPILSASLVGGGNSSLSAATAIFDAVGVVAKSGRPVTPQSKL
jgi:hypothetical protein